MFQSEKLIAPISYRSKFTLKYNSFADTLRAYVQFRTFFAQNRTFLPKIAPFLSKICLRLGKVKAGHMAGARRAPMQRPEGSLCRTSPKGPNPSRVAKPGPIMFEHEGPKPNRPRA